MRAVIRQSSVRIGVIAKKELNSYIDSPIAYIVMVSFLVIAGWMFFSALFLSERADMRFFFAPSVFAPSVLLLILAPSITMRLIAEERKTGSLELLTTMPVRDLEVILGKFLAAWILMVAAILCTLVYAISISFIGSLDWGATFAGYIGFILFTGSLLSMGLLCSTFTENQIIAFITGFLLCAVLYFIYWLQFFMPPALAGIVDFISVSSHLNNIARGVLDSRDVFYYLSLIGGSLFLATRSLERQHA